MATEIYTKLAIQHRLFRKKSKLLKHHYHKSLGRFSIKKMAKPKKLSKNHFQKKDKQKLRPFLKDLSQFYARALLSDTLGISNPSDIDIKLYAAQLLQPQNIKTIFQRGSLTKHALILSSDPLEQNIFSTLLRNQRFLPLQVKNKKALMKVLKYSFDILIVSEKFKEMSMDMLAPMFKISEKKPLLIRISKTYDVSDEKLGFDILLQHPFSCETFIKTLKQFFSLQ